MSEHLRDRFDRACLRFDRANDAAVWSGDEHPAVRLRWEVEHVWREADAAGVDVADIARRWGVGRMGHDPEADQ